MPTDWEKLDDEVPRRRFEFKSDKSYKFWEIELSGTLIQLRHGRIGNQGRRQEIVKEDSDAAKREYAVRVDKKLKERYREVIRRPPKDITTDEFTEQLVDHEPFLNAILESPDDLDAYHIYADWLLENDDPLGEFIQVQLALEDPHLEMRDEPELRRRNDDLLSTHARQWLGDLKPLLWELSGQRGSQAYEFSRGMLSGIHVENFSGSIGHWIAHSPLCRLLRKLRIASVSHGANPVRDHDALPEEEMFLPFGPMVNGDFRNLRDLELGSRVSFAPFDGTGLTSVLPFMPRLERLVMLNVEMEMAKLAAMPLPALNSFTLATTNLDRDIAKLAKAAWMPRLSQLQLDGPVNSDHIMTLTSQQALANLELLTLAQDNRVTSSGWEALKEAGVACLMDETAFIAY